eukprot:6468776-Amphidinium_carterae.1
MATGSTPRTNEIQKYTSASGRDCCKVMILHKMVRSVPSMTRRCLQCIRVCCQNSLDMDSLFFAAVCMVLQTP